MPIKATKVIEEGAKEAVANMAAALLDSLAKYGGDDPTTFFARKRVPEMGEQRLAYEMIALAIQDAQLDPTAVSKARQLHVARMRDNARAWLNDHAAIMSARLCFEALGMDYDVARDALRKHWETGTAVVLPWKASSGTNTKVV